MRRFADFLCALVALLGLTACGGGSSAPAVEPTIEVEFLSGTTSMLDVAMTPGDGDMVMFEVTYEVTAIGGDVYVDETCTGGGIALLPEDGNVFEIGEDLLVFTELSSTAIRLPGCFLVEEGETEVFTLTVIAEARSDGFGQLLLEGVGWSASPGEGDQMFVLPIGEFETVAIWMDYFE